MDGIADTLGTALVDGICDEAALMDGSSDGTVLADGLAEMLGVILIDGI